MDNPSDDNINIFEYIKENYVGLLLLFSTILIVYCIDYITYVNSLFFASPSPIPGISGTANVAINMLQKKKRTKKH